MITRYQRGVPLEFSYTGERRSTLLAGLAKLSSVELTFDFGIDVAHLPLSSTGILAACVVDLRNPPARIYWHAHPRHR